MSVSELASLIANGANPNERDPTVGGFTPLHLAVDIECEIACWSYDAGNLEAKPEAGVSRILFASGASPFIADFDGLTPFQLAIGRNRAEALLLFGLVSKHEGTPK
ncbi:hypothetical protein [Chitinimonas sp.]|uniref:hypothetical protein n=1 Tax=Chitinimonas sp. TaxID=1934313 RepID=UPI0035B4B3E1